MKKKRIIGLILSVIVINGFSQDTIQNKTIPPFLKEYWNSIYSFNKVAAKSIAESFEVYIDFHKDAFNYLTDSPSIFHAESIQDRLTGEWTYTISTPFQEQRTGKLIISQKDGDLFLKMDDDNYSGETQMHHQPNTAKYVATDTIEQLGITIKYTFLLVSDGFLQVNVNAGNIRYIMNAKKENKESDE